MVQRRLIIITGPERSGSRLCAKIVAHVLGTAHYSYWDGCGLVTGEHCVLHRTLPYLNPPHWPDFGGYVKNFLHVYGAPGTDWIIQIVICTRDNTLREHAVIADYKHAPSQVRIESDRAAEEISKLTQLGYEYMYWSYETLVWLGQIYLRELYSFIEVDTNFSILLGDANKRRISEIQDLLEWR